MILLMIYLSIYYIRGLTRGLGARNYRYGLASIGVKLYYFIYKIGSIKSKIIQLLIIHTNIFKRRDLL